jgi:ABC-type transport system involved in multi-copper enzyme maturation permease subunit
VVAKEWRDARWKLALGMFAFLVIVVVGPRSYEKILADVQREIEMMRLDLQAPDRSGVPEEIWEGENYAEQIRRDIEEMQEPGYSVKVAGWEVRGIQDTGNYVVVLPLAGLLGVGLVSGEVSRGSIFLLLSGPISRGRMLLVKYSVCAACLLLVALVGAVGAIVSAYAHGYPSEAVDVGEILVHAALIWLGALFVLGLALLASVVLRDVIQTIIATAATVYLILTGPDLLRSLLEWIFWISSDYNRPWREMRDWYGVFDRWNLAYYWVGMDPYTGKTMMTQSFLVCLVAAVPPLLMALWLFRRKAY